MIVPQQGNRARTRAIRERMAQTGEPYSVAARHHDAERQASRDADAGHNDTAEATE